MPQSEITSFLWYDGDLIRHTFMRGEYQDIILQLPVLRRIDQVLEPTKQKLLKTYSTLKGTLDLLLKASGHAFYPTSRFTFEWLVDKVMRLPTDEV